MNPRKIKLLKDDGKKYDFVSEETKIRSSDDMNDVCFEFYNKSGCQVWFENIHPNMIKKCQTPQKIVVENESFAFIPHHYYLAFSKDGRPVTGISNYGKEKFKGNKMPSRIN